MTEIEKPKKNADQETPSAQFKVWSLAWEMGYTIAIPIVLLALLGRLADKYWGTSPWLILLGVLLSVFISTFLVYKKTIDILK